MKTYPFTEEGAEEALQDLGDDPAATLRALGITGRRNDDACCPVARYLTRVIPDVTCARVFLEEHGIEDEEYYVESFVELLAAGEGMRSRREVVAPTEVAAFVAAFDDGRYPDLIEEEAA